MVTIYLLSLTLIIGAVGALLSLYRYRNYWTRKGLIPHLKPIPIFGNSTPVLLSRTNSMPEFVSQLYNLFPDSKYMGAMLFHTPVILLRDLQLIKDISIKDFDNFTDHNSFFPIDVDPLFGKNLFVLQGSRWKEMRNTLTPSFTGSKMKFMFKLISDCSQNFVQYFLDNPEKAFSVEMKDTFTRYTNDVIATVAFGITIDSMKDRDNEFYMKGKDISNFNSFGRGLKFLALIFFPAFMKAIGEPITSRSANRFFKRIVQETIVERKKMSIVRPDMIHLLMEATRNEKGVEVTTEDIVAQAFFFFLAGYATTATVMGFAAHELAMNSEIQEKLRNEVDTFTKQEDNAISYDTLGKMKYLDMVISETLRKYPLNAMTDRVCLKNYTLPKATRDSEEFTIEPNTIVWLPIYALHHDEKYFPDPEKFDPERFSEENKEKIDPCAYIPFGIGPRKCIGNRFALMEIKILFVHLLQNFVLEKEERTRHPVPFEKGFVFAADGEFWVKFKKRVK